MAGLTATQANWASGHDWFIRAVRALNGQRWEYTVVVVDVEVHQDGTVTESVVEFTDYHKLRAWAGY